MTQTFEIAVIGATGTVGETLVQILEELDFPVGTLYLLAGSNSAGASVPFRGKNVRVREVDEFDFSKAQLAFFAAGPAVTLSFAPRATAAGCSVIDLSGALPADQAPQVVPEANAHVLDGLKKPFQLSSPSPCATHLAVVLAPLRGLLDIQRVSVTANLAVSAQGREAVSELARQTAELLNVRPLEPQFFDRQMDELLVLIRDGEEAVVRGLADDGKARFLGEVGVLVIDLENDAPRGFAEEVLGDRSVVERGHQ